MKTQNQAKTFFAVAWSSHASTRCRFVAVAWRECLTATSEIDRFAKTQVDRKERWASAKISRNEPLSGSWVKVESTNACDESARLTQIIGEAGALREEGVAVRIPTCDDVEGTSGPRDDERVQLQSPSQVDRALDEKPVPHIERRSAPLCAQIV